MGKRLVFALDMRRGGKHHSRRIPNSTQRVQHYAGSAMGEMRCVAIGVSDAEKLTYLPGAVNGARAFGGWAKNVGIPTEILTDEERPIGVDTVKAAFQRSFAGRPRISRFLVYFAGHGLALPAGGDLWLLSQWYSNVCAISVSRLRDRLAYFGIDQLTILSDACRSLAPDRSSASLDDLGVLDRGPFDAKDPDLDWMRASSPYQAAYMVKGKSDEEDRCIFSGLLIEALAGAHDAAFDPPGGAQISNFSLKKFLIREAPLLAGRYHVPLEPQIDTGLMPPDNIYVNGRPAATPAPKPWPSESEIGAMSADPGGARGRRGWSTFGLNVAAEAFSVRPGGPSSEIGLTRGGASEPQKNLMDVVERDKQNVAYAVKQRVAEVDRILSQYKEQDRPTHFETGSGLFVSGVEIADVCLGRRAVAAPAERLDARRLHSVNSPVLVAPAPLLIAFENGNWGGAAAIPDRIATFTVQGEGVVSVIYRTLGGDTYDDLETERAVAELRAGVLSAEAGYGLATRLRFMKAQDPVRGVLAAYIYYALGDVESVRRVAFYLQKEGVPIPYDIALLGRFPARVGKDGAIEVETAPTRKRAPRSSEEEPYDWTYASTRAAWARVAGAFPWLRQGWSLLEDADPSDLIVDGLSDLRKELLPSPFTTLNARGGAALKRMIEEA
jgi:hypothetical protein